MPWVMALRVDSLPATARAITKKPNSSSVSPRPSLSALVRPVEQLAPVVCGYPEQVGDLQRQFRGDLLDEVATAPGHRLGHDPLRPLGHHAVEGADRPRGEAARDYPRVWVCSGASWLISTTRVISTDSRVLVSGSRMIAPFCQPEKTLLFFETLRRPHAG